MNQLVHMCIWYDDDKYGTRGVEPAIIERMWQLMVEDSPMLLRDEDSIPFTIDDVMSSMEAFDMDEIVPPPSLLKDGSFHFLLPKEKEEQQHTPSRTPSLPLWPDSAINIFGASKR